MTRGDALDLGLAILVAESDTAAYEAVGVVGTMREAIEVCRDDLASRMARLEAGASPLCPEAYTLWCRNQDGTYERYTSMDAVTLDATLSPAPAGIGGVGAREASLVLTTEGFLNLGQACEYRLRYADVTQSDAINGIDVLLANGTSHLIEHDDPGFDQLVEYLEEQGYTISVNDGRGR